MAFNPYSNGKGYAQEMARIRVYGEKCTLPDRRRYTARGHYLTRTRKYDSGWTRKEIKGTLPKNNSKRDSSKSQLCTVRRRFHWCDLRSLVLSGAQAPSPVSKAVSNPSLRHW